MTPLALITPEKHVVTRSELRQKQRATLRLVKGNRIVVIAARDEEEQKLILDKKYFDELVQKLRSALETLEITMDQKLLSRILRAAKTLDTDIGRGKLHSFEEAFGEE